MSHERALKAQAKKMNVESLRGKEDKDGDSAEFKIAKVIKQTIKIISSKWDNYILYQKA